VLTGLVSKFYQISQFAAFKAEQMFKGKRSVPIETLKRFLLIVRLNTAKQINAYPPPRLLNYVEFRGLRQKRKVFYGGRFGQ
jgi:putative tryptophan/tyrosine transport system substrate-binding protein